MIIQHSFNSGLDDFPRASHPTDQEYHVDLRCWMALASKLMANIGSLIGKNHEKYSKMADLLYDPHLLDELHWSEQHGAYLDYGLHSDDVTLQRPRPAKGLPGQLQKQRVVLEEPKYQFVNQVGYVSKYYFVFLTGFVRSSVFFRIALNSASYSGSQTISGAHSAPLQELDIDVNSASLQNEF